MIDPESLQLGNVIFVNLYDITGNEQRDTRPAIIMAIHPETKLFMVILLTSKDVSRFRFTLLIKTKKSNGLRNDSYAMTFQTRAIAFKRIKERIGKIEETYMLKLKEQLKNYLEL